MLNKVILLFLALFILLSGASFADQRNYVWTYEYMTMPQGEAEFEIYTTLEQPTLSDPKTSAWKHWMELEYGLTDRWDISLYQQFKQANTAAASTFGYDGYKARTRYRIGEKNVYPLDALLYLEYIGKNAMNQSPQGEVKLILGKDISNLNFSYNQIYKWTLQTGVGEHEFSAGAGLQSAAFSLGLESKGNYSSGKYSIGPTVSVSTNKFWINLGIAAGLNSKSDYMQSRLLMGVLL